VTRPNPLNLPQRLLDRFECGDCHILAKRLARVSCWNLATFTTDCGEPTLHAFVLSPDGLNACDVRGVRELSDFVFEWRVPSHTAVKTWTPASLNDSPWWTPPAYGHYSYAAARRVAGILVDKYNLEG